MLIVFPNPQENEHKNNKFVFVYLPGRISQILSYPQMKSNGISFVSFGFLVILENLLVANSLSASPINLKSDRKTSPSTGKDSINLNVSDNYDKEKLFIDWFKDAREEISKPRKLDVIGEIPSYVQGSLVRNGPGIFGSSDRRYTHIFDGLAKLAKFDLTSECDGSISVKFCTRFVESLWKKLTTNNNFLPPSVSIGPMEPKLNMLESIIAGMTASALFDNTSVNVQELPDGSFAATTDALVQQGFDIDSLTSTGKVQYSSGIDGMNSGIPLLSTAHAKLKDGMMYNYVLELGLKPVAHIVRTNEDMSRESIASIPLDYIPYIHDLSVTENYVVLCVYPLKMPIASLMNGEGIMPQLEYDQSAKTKIYCIPRKKTASSSNETLVFETQAFFAYHHVNAFEDNDNIVLDMLAYESASMANGAHGFLYLGNMESVQLRNKQERESNVWRFHLNTNEKSSTNVSPEKLILKDSETGNIFGLELATVSPKFQGLKYQYCYGFNGFYRGDIENGSFMEWSLVKQDLSENTYQLWHEEYSYPSEPIFVPNPESNKEDDGVLLSCVYESRRKESYLLVLDAASMTEIARAYTGCRVPPQFHGKWF